MPALNFKKEFVAPVLKGLYDPLWVNLTNSDLTYALLGRAKLRNVNLDHTILDGAKFADLDNLYNQ